MTVAVISQEHLYFIWTWLGNAQVVAPEHQIFKRAAPVEIPVMVGSDFKIAFIQHTRYFPCARSLIIGQVFVGFPRGSSLHGRANNVYTGNGSESVIKLVQIHVNFIESLWLPCG